MTADFLTALLGANLAAGAAILLIVALRRPVRRLAGARVAYGLWLLAPLAALASLLPPLPITQPLIAPAPIRPVAESAVTFMGAAFAGARPAADPALSLLAVWAVGSLAVLTFIVGRQFAALARLGRLAPEPGGVFRAANPGVGPAVLGLVRARIVLPADFEDRFEAGERALIVAHERAHLSAGDLRVNAAVWLAVCVSWFNPLALLAARLVRADQELARDEAVVTRHPGKRKVYAQALLKAQVATRPLPLACYWPARSSRLLKERISMLAAKSPRRRARALGVALIATLAAGAGYGAWAVAPKAAAPAVSQLTTHETVTVSFPVDAPPPAPSVKRALAITAAIDADKARLDQLLGKGSAQAVAETEAARQKAMADYNQELAQLTNSVLPAPPPAPPAAPAAAPKGPSVITNPQWVAQPAAADLARAYPQRALAAGVEGKATITCVANDDGTVSKCIVTTENPAGNGFGAAAMTLSPKFQMVPATRDGASVAGARVAIPVEFKQQGTQD